MPLPKTWKKPSLARKALEGTFNKPIEELQGSWPPENLDSVKFLLDVLSNVDEAILFATFSPEDGLTWRKHLAAIQSAVRRWQNNGAGKLPFAHAVELYKLLKTCPDDIVPKAEPRLTFVADTKLRASIARDIDSLDALVRDEEWKAATVIGGSVVEALLVERLSDGANLAKAQAAEAAHVAKKDKSWSSATPLEDWKLWKLIAMASELTLIDDTVAHSCEAARDYRNLIHPTKERAEAPCDRGTALSAVAAVENLVATFSGMR